MNLWIAKINKLFLKAESLTGLPVFCLLTGLVFTGFAMLYVAPRFEPGFNGAQYTELSLDPFSFTGDNPLRFRIFAPLLGYITGLKGPLFFILPLIFAVLFLSFIYGIYRKKQFSPLEALSMVCIITFSCVFLIQIQAPGYTDVIYYFFLFLSFTFVRKPWLSAIFFMLGLLTHESLLFMLPGLVIYYWYLHPSSLKPAFKFALLLIIATIPMFVFREWMSSRVAVAYDIKFYLSEANISFTLKKVLPYIPLGFFFVFKLFWILPVLMAIKAFRKGKYILLLFVFVMLTCDLAQVVVAYDVTRMLCLAFPLVLISAEELRSEWTEKKFIIVMSLLILANFMIPQYFMSCDGPVPMPCVFPFLQTF
jgi:hypothetical protein